ncbi:hypothetical protein CAPTEDRAFT_226604 [Capitella teleta]|uniref:Pacifastin domain-containing protein n=1 Tax=Capitella teleta TaxID=283909 RepID=R7T438_CAPTE|nr:hypothetical protein CAPTEDRAFT_226604 [Capitella teleta]|eukprot:ELT87637.1 hypothetical protein CAPTEDRAFT_226604 [Capitella teleta]
MTRCLCGHYFIKMQMLLVVFAACAFVVSARTVDRDTPPCNRRGVWFDGCNYCRCSDDKEVICTQKYCPPRPIHTQGGLGGGPSGPSIQSAGEISIPEGEGFPVCIQIQPWYDGCNWCSCTDGLTMCTKRVCIPEGADPFA